MKTALVLVASVVASLSAHLALLNEHAPKQHEGAVATSTGRVQEAVVVGKRLAKFKKPSLVTIAR